MPRCLDGSRDATDGLLDLYLPQERQHAYAKLPWAVMSQRGTKMESEGQEPLAPRVFPGTTKPAKKRAPARASARTLGSQGGVHDRGVEDGGKPPNEVSALLGFQVTSAGQ